MKRQTLARRLVREAVEEDDMIDLLVADGRTQVELGIWAEDIRGRTAGRVCGTETRHEQEDVRNMK